MANNHNPDKPVDVTSPFIGRSILDGLRTNFSSNNLMQEGDDLMDRSRVLLNRHIQLIEVRDQAVIRRSIVESVKTIYVPQWVS
jgi:hypothetical protein